MRLLLKRVLKKYYGEGLDWIYLAQDKKEWQVAVNTAMNVLMP
jgi:hypothetical protein